MPFIPHVLESWSWPREGEAVVQSILLGAAKACSSQEHWEKGSNRPFFLRCSRNKEENRKNSCSQYLYSTLDSPEEIKGGKITFQSEDTTFPQSKLLTAPSSSLGSGISPCQAWEDGHTAEHIPKHNWDTSGAWGARLAVAGPWVKWHSWDFSSPVTAEQKELLHLQKCWEQLWLQEWSTGCGPS